MKMIHRTATVGYLIEFWTRARVRMEHKSWNVPVSFGWAWNSDKAVSVVGRHEMPISYMNGLY